MKKEWTKIVSYKLLLEEKKSLQKKINYIKINYYSNAMVF